jgi:endonuclease YncB( thermonuclease family)
LPSLAERRPDHAHRGLGGSSAGTELGCSALACRKTRPKFARDGARRFFVGCLLMLICALDGALSATTIHGVVVKIRDGDTVQLQTDSGRRIEIRLNAIDAPERRGDASPSQPYAQRARMHLARLAAKRRATFHHFSMDRYGRHVGLLVIETADGSIDAGLWQVASGMAWVYTRYLSELPHAIRQRYRDAEKRARLERRGLWQDDHATAPWEWRQRHSRSTPSYSGTRAQWARRFIQPAHDAR